MASLTFHISFFSTEIYIYLKEYTILHCLSERIKKQLMIHGYVLLIQNSYFFKFSRHYSRVSSVTVTMETLSDILNRILFIIYCSSFIFQVDNSRTFLYKNKNTQKKRYIVCFHSSEKCNIVVPPADIVMTRQTIRM